MFKERMGVMAGFESVVFCPRGSMKARRVEKRTAGG